VTIVKKNQAPLPTASSGWPNTYVVSNVGNLGGCHRCAKKIGEGGIGDRVEKHIIQVTTNG